MADSENPASMDNGGTATATLSQPPQSEHLHKNQEDTPKESAAVAEVVEESVDFLSAAFQNEASPPPPLQQGQQTAEESLLSLPQPSAAITTSPENKNGDAVDFLSAAFESGPPPSQQQPAEQDLLFAAFQQPPPPSTTTSSQSPSLAPDGAGEVQQDFDFLSAAFQQPTPSQESQSQSVNHLSNDGDTIAKNDIDPFSPQDLSPQPPTSLVGASPDNTKVEIINQEIDLLGSGDTISNSSPPPLPNPIPEESSQKSGELAYTDTTEPVDPSPATTQKQSEKGSSSVENTPQTTTDTKDEQVAPTSTGTLPPPPSQESQSEAGVAVPTASSPANQSSSPSFQTENSSSSKQKTTISPSVTTTTTAAKLEDASDPLPPPETPVQHKPLQREDLMLPGLGEQTPGVTSKSPTPQASNETENIISSVLPTTTTPVPTTDKSDPPQPKVLPDAFTPVAVTGTSLPEDDSSTLPHQAPSTTNTSEQSAATPTTKASANDSVALAAEPSNTTGTNEVATKTETAADEPSTPKAEVPPTEANNDVEGSDSNTGVVAPVTTETTVGTPGRKTTATITTTAVVPTTPDPRTAPENSPDTPLPQRVEWLQKELHAAHTLIMKLQQRKGEEEEEASEANRASDALMVEIQASLQSQMNLRAEAEETARLALTRADKLEQELERTREEMQGKTEELNKNLISAVEETSNVEIELKKIREERDEQARKETALISRLNAAKKKEAVKANKAEQFENQVEGLESQVTELQGKLDTVTEEKNQLQEQLIQLKQFSQQRIQQLETSISEERKLNDERKRKMKGFVEAKAEEIRSSKEANLSLQTELDQTNRSLNELNQRMKQLHAQWVQSQTRNRELQRDMNKIQKDSEKMLKVGDTLELKLSRSALATEEHKTKRLTAKNELMAVLRQLEAERDLNNRLRDSIKFTFTPKALSQQQLIQETLQEFENELQKLSSRLGRPLPPPPVDQSSVTGGETISEESLNQQDSTVTDSSSSDHAANDPGEGTSEPGRPSHSEVNTSRLVDKLESETQRVSQCIMALSTNVERMHSVLAGPGTRNCVSALQGLLLGGSGNGNGTSSEETAAMTLGSRRSSGGPRYGQVPGTMT